MTILTVKIISVLAPHEYVWRQGLWFALITLHVRQGSIVEVFLDVHDHHFKLLEGEVCVS